MKAKVLAVASLLVGLAFSGSALAGDYGQNGNDGTKNTAISGSLAGSNNEGNAQTIVNEGTTIPDNTPNVNAPALTTTLTETCMGSTSAGVAAAGFGLSLGSTWRDDECVRRLNARELRAMGLGLVAKELMCDNADIRAAFERAGKQAADLPICQASIDEREAAQATPATTTQAPVAEEADEVTHDDGFEWPSDEDRA